MEHIADLDLETYYAWDLDAEIGEAYYFELVAFLRSPPCYSSFAPLRICIPASFLDWNFDLANSCLCFASRLASCSSTLLMRWRL